MRLFSSMASAKAGAAYIFLLAGVCAALHVGKLSPALPVLQETMNISLLQAGFLLSLVQFAAMLLGLGVGLMADGLGLKRCMMSGLLILFMASCLGGFSTQVLSLLLWRMMEGIGFLLVTLSAPGMIRNSVASSQLDKMMGFWGAYMPLGTGIALLMGPWVIHEYSWPAWWWGLSALTLVIGIFILIMTPADTAHVKHVSHSQQAPQGLGPRSKSEALNASWRTRVRQTLTSLESWLLAVCFFMYSGQWLAVIGFLPVIYTQAGYDGSLTAVLSSVVAAVNMIGNIASGILLGKRIRPQSLLYTGFIFMAVGSAIAFADHPWSQTSESDSAIRYTGVLAFSMVGGLIPGTLFALAAQLTSGKPVLSTTLGWMQQWSAFGQFAGPPLVAWVAVLAGGWQWTWLVTGACSVLGLILAQQISMRCKA
jgi:CP family cyanate transporter-like MFS transporter